VERLPKIEPDCFAKQDQAAEEQRAEARKRQLAAEQEMKAGAERFTAAHPGMDISQGNVVTKAWLNAHPWQPLMMGPRDKIAGCKSAICKGLVMESGTHSLEFVCLVKTGWHRYGVCRPDMDPTKVDSPSRDTDRGWSIFAGGEGSGTPAKWAGNFEHNSSFNPWEGMRCWEVGDTVRLALDDHGDTSGRWSLTVFLKKQGEHSFTRLGVATDNENGVVLQGRLCWHVEMSEMGESVRIQNAISHVGRLSSPWLG
jgi:hypothetical protein